MKPRIRYLNGCVEINSDEDIQYKDLLSKSKFLTRHPTKDGVWFFFENHAGVKFFKDHLELLENMWDIDEEVYIHMNSWIDYTNGHAPIKKVIPNGLILEPYQHNALDLMLSNDLYCIFLGQGTGKTIIAISYLSSIKAISPDIKTLIVTPKNVIPQYKKEIIKWLGNDDNIDIINYESLSKVKNNYDIIFYDESHKLKSCTSNMNAIATSLRAPHIYLFTGSPQDKSKHEILAQLKVLKPCLFPAKYKVYARFFELDEYNQPEKEKDGTELNEIISAMCFGDKTENLIKLPVAKHEVIKCEFTDKTLYNTFLKKQVAEHEGNVIVADNPGVLRIMLKEMCNGFVMFNCFDHTTQKESKKLLSLENPKLNKLKDLIDALDSAVIYTQFDYDLLTVDTLLTKLNRSHVCVNGKTSRKDAESNINNFKNNSVDFLVIQAQSGNTGLNLQNTNNMIFYSLPDSYIVYEQCLYRIRRRGQEKECNYYYLLTKGTVELAIYRMLEQKKSFTNKTFELYRKKGVDNDN